MDVNNFEGLKISIASPEKIRSWSYGEVKKAHSREMVPHAVFWRNLPYFSDAACGSAMKRRNPASSGRIPHRWRGITAAGAAPQAWFQS